MGTFLFSLFSVRRRKIPNAILACALGLGCGLQAQEPQSTPLQAQGRHLLLQVVVEAGTFRVVKQTLVELPLPVDRGAPELRTWKFQALSPTSPKVFEGGLDDPTVCRGEFASATEPGRIDAVHLRLPGSAHFVLRVPCMEGGQIDFYERLAGESEGINAKSPIQPLFRKLGSALLSGEAK